MRVMLRHNHLGHLTVYVAKKDLEEEVIKQEITEQGKVLTLANGWELVMPSLEEPIKLPQTIIAKRIA